jgi:formate hydrogenlyase transcriptional activator
MFWRFALGPLSCDISRNFSGSPVNRDLGATAERSAPVGSDSSSGSTLPNIRVGDQSRLALNPTSLIPCASRPPYRFVFARFFVGHSEDSMNAAPLVLSTDIEAQLRFEMLLTELSARFVNATAESIDAQIVQSQKQIVQALDLDRCTLVQLAEPNRFAISHCWAAPGVDPMPGFAVADIPWTVSVILRGEEVRFSRLDGLPDEAARDRETARRLGPVSSAIFPFKVGGKVIGALAFCNMFREREWSDALVNRLRLFGEMIANAIGRIRAEEATLKALDEVRRLRDQLERENAYLRQEAKALRGRAGLIGESAALRRVLSLVEQVAPTNSNVLITGETGTGKEMVASAIHEMSLRTSRPMVPVSCAAIPATLMESELFGREKGAYTGAMSRQVGRFELAHGSTLFLDEVGELSLEVQAKLLRVLEERKLERLGSPKTIAVDVRIIAATNSNLEHAMKQQKFRNDLFYRLNVFPIQTPALRERPEDIPLLVHAFVKEFSRSIGTRTQEIDEDSIKALQRYPWPGNIRELRNIVERAVISSSSARLHIEAPTTGTDNATRSVMSDLEVRREHIRSVLERTCWRVRGKDGAAEMLGLKPTTLDAMIIRFGLIRPAKGELH